VIQSGVPFKSLDHSHTVTTSEKIKMEDIPNTMDDYSRYFAEVLDNFKDEMKDRDFQAFKATGVKNVERLIFDIQKVQEQSGALMAFTRIETFLDRMKQFGEVIQFCGYDPDIMAFIWGPTRKLLQV
jgi:hypothetical protein